MSSPVLNVELSPAAIEMIYAALTDYGKRCGYSMTDARLKIWDEMQMFFAARHKETKGWLEQKTKQTK